MMRFMAICSVFLLTACASEQELAARQAQQDAEDDQQCTGLGFKPATEGYGNCRLRIAEMRTQQRLANSYDRAHTCFGMGFGYGRYDF